LPRLKLDPATALKHGWGVYSYMVGAAYRHRGDGALACDRLKIRLMTAGLFEGDARQYAMRTANTLWANMPYFTVPMRSTPVFGEIRNKGMVGFVLGAKFTAFDKPVPLWEAIQGVENLKNNSIRPCPEDCSRCKVTQSQSIGIFKSARTSAARSQK